jgi:hypothetical protein
MDISPNGAKLLTGATCTRAADEYSLASLRFLGAIFGGRSGRVVPWASGERRCSKQPSPLARPGQRVPRSLLPALGWASRQLSRKSKRLLTRSESTKRRAWNRIHSNSLPTFNLFDGELFDSAPDVELIEIEDVSLTTACDACVADADLQAIQNLQQNAPNAVGDYIEGSWFVEIPSESAGTIIEQALRAIDA